MADRADVYVKNMLNESIKVQRKLPDGFIDLDTTVANDSEERINLPDTEVSMFVKVPEGVDTKYCPFKVKSDVDLAVSCSRTDSNWTIKIIPNDLPPDTPTTVNVTVGDVEPDE